MSGDTAKPGLWTLDWTLDWTMDWTRDYHYQSIGLHTGHFQSRQSLYFYGQSSESDSTYVLRQYFKFWAVDSSDDPNM